MIMLCLEKQPSAAAKIQFAAQERHTSANVQPQVCPSVTKGSPHTWGDKVAWCAARYDWKGSLWESRPELCVALTAAPKTSHQELCRHHHGAALYEEKTFKMLHNHHRKFLYLLTFISSTNPCSYSHGHGTVYHKGLCRCSNCFSLHKRCPG